MMFNELVKLSHEMGSRVAIRRSERAARWQTTWKTSGHWDKYHDDMFITESEDRQMALKPMNCPGHCQLFCCRSHSRILGAVLRKPTCCATSDERHPAACCASPFRPELTATSSAPGPDPDEVASVSLPPCLRPTPPVRPATAGLGLLNVRTSGSLRRSCGTRASRRSRTRSTDTGSSTRSMRATAPSADQRSNMHI